MSIHHHKGVKCRKSYSCLLGISFLIVVISIIITSNDSMVGIPLDKEIEKSPIFDLSIPDNNICEPLLLSSDIYNEKINIVVFGHGYEDYSSMKIIVINGLFDDEKSMFATDPFKNRKDDFNIWLYPEIVTYSVDKRIIDKYTSKSKDCPVNYVLVISSQRVQSSAGCYLRFSMTNSNPYTIKHELGGHVIGCLSDEYAKLTIPTSNFPNCDVSPICDKFEGLDISGCYLGCNNKTMYRSEYESVMRKSSAPSFGDVNEYIINKRMDLQLERNAQTHNNIKG